MQVGLIDLLKPQFLAGLELPDWLDHIVTFIRIIELQTVWSDEAVLYTGIAKVVGAGDASWDGSPRVAAPSGSYLQWEDINLQFRLTVPRVGGDFIRDALTDLKDVPGLGSLTQDVQSVLDALEVSGDESQPSDYPSVAFRLELLLNVASLHLPPGEFLPARIGKNGWLEPDPDFSEIKFEIPRLAMVLTQGDDIGDIDFSLEGWGIKSLDDPMDLYAGELIRMVPPLCLHQSRVVGFGMDRAVLDLSEDFTPPELLEEFGIGDEFSGFWMPLVRFFLAPSKTHGFAFDLRAEDLLVDLNHGVSGEFAFAIMRRNDKLKVEPILYEGDRRVNIVDGSSEEGDGSKDKFRIANVAADGELQLAVHGGMPPYKITVKLDGSKIAAQPYEGNANRLRWLLERTESGEAMLEIEVKDSSSPTQSWEETIKLILGEPGRVVDSERIDGEAKIVQISGTPGYRVELARVQPDQDAVLLQVIPGNFETVSGGDRAGMGLIRVPVEERGSPGRVEVTWPKEVVPDPPNLNFGKDIPGRGAKAYHSTLNQYRDSKKLKKSIDDYVSYCAGEIIKIEASASYDSEGSMEGYNQELSEKRGEILKTLLMEAGVEESLIKVNAIGFSESKPVWEEFKKVKNLEVYQPEEFRYARAEPCKTENTETPGRVVEVFRTASVDKPIRIPTERGPAPNPPNRPPIFREISFRVKLQRNQLVLGEVKGQLDFQTQAERTAASIHGATNDGEYPGMTSETGLQIRAREGATADPDANPGDGIVDWRLSMFYDTATKRLTQEIVLGAGEGDRNGLLEMTSDGESFFSNVFGAILTFAPLLANSLDSALTADGGDATEEFILAGAQLALAATLGGAGMLKTRNIILYGGEITASQTLDSDPTFNDIGILFDYGVHFEVDISVGPIRIQSTPDTPMKVRYKALGFKLDFQNENIFRPIFDTSKGYELDLSDPGLFNLGSALGKILKVLGARLARNNPFILEFDLGLKVNLGIISVDTIRVTIPLDPPGTPTIIPTSVSVDIPKTIVGKGSIDMRNGFAGSIDVSLVPVKLRIAANLAVTRLKGLPENRSATGIYISLEVEFPSAIPIAGTGMGIFGILGLFAMHYKRAEVVTEDIPALHWFNEIAGGNPVALRGKGGQDAWVPEVDRWSFGVGVVLGTMEGGTLLNLKGMLVLELPGPRILILVNAQILSEKPKTEGEVNAGILAVVDLDFNLNRLTIGLFIDYEIVKLLSLKLPVEASFSFNDTSNWHLYLGEIKAPASADVLGLVKAEGYLMFDGDGIEGFPAENGTITLQGMAIALGIRASVVFGKQSIGLYLKVSASMDVGLSFSPYYLYGIMRLEGKLRLFIVSISAYAKLTGEVGKETSLFLTGKVCGKVRLGFFSIKGCVKITIGKKPKLEPPPPLIKAMILQSRSPALIQGQGTDIPIDTSLGHAVELSELSDPVGPEIPIVPIDAIPILKMQAAPLLLPDFDANSFVSQPVPATVPRSYPMGWIPQGEDLEYQYRLAAVEINEMIPDQGLGEPPAVWRSTSYEAKSNDTSVDLALLSWNPEHTPRAIQRSKQLTEYTRAKWGNACQDPAPETYLLWTFNQKELGPSSVGWSLEGMAWPDPPDTYRSRQPDKRLLIQEPSDHEWDLYLMRQVLAEFGYGHRTPAQVLGDDKLLNRVFDGLGIAGPAENIINNNLNLLSKGRALALPYWDLVREREGILDDPFPNEYEEIRKEEGQQAIRIKTNELKELRLFLAVDEFSYANTGDVWIRNLDSEGNFLEECRISQISTRISRPSALPSRWRNPNGPWKEQVDSVYEFFENRFPKHQLYLLDWSPASGDLTTYVELESRYFDPNFKDRSSLPYPWVLLGIIECCREEELIRAQHDERILKSKIETLETALKAEELRPLLEPNKTYKISVKYYAEARQLLEDGTYAESEGAGILQTQHFAFKTDNSPPIRMNPWILGTSPAPDDPYHFAEDAIKIYFNDESAIQLYNAYNIKLKSVIRRANGKHPEDQPDLNFDSLLCIDKPPMERILTPFEESIRYLISGKTEGQSKGNQEKEYGLPCVDASDPGMPPKVVTVPIPLERGMSYTFEIEPDKPIGLNDEPQSPLFRMSFTSSRFLSAAELADYMANGPSDHLVLEQALVRLSPTPKESEMQQALMDAGLGTNPLAQEPSIKYVWAPNGEGDYDLQALLIDSPEALWRFRPEPAREILESDTGEMEHWVEIPKLFLEIAEGDTSQVEQFSYSPGGTRTLVYLKPGAEYLVLHLLKHPHFLDKEKDPAEHIIFDNELPRVAPWILHEL